MLRPTAVDKFASACMVKGARCGLDLVGDTSGINGAGKIADDHTSRPLREILERRRALAGSRMQDDLMSFVEERPRGGSAQTVGAAGDEDPRHGLSPIRRLERQHHLDGPTLVHRSVALGCLLQRQREIEDPARIDLAVADQSNQVR